CSSPRTRADTCLSVERRRRSDPEHHRFDHERPRPRGHSRIAPSVERKPLHDNGIRRASTGRHDACVGRGQNQRGSEVFDLGPPEPNAVTGGSIMTLIRWNPLLPSVGREIPFLNDDFNRLFDGYLTRTLRRNGEPGYAPAVDIEENADEFIVHADLPG